MINSPRSRETSDDRRLLYAAGLALPAAVWVLGIISPPRGGLTPTYLGVYSVLLASLVVVDQTVPEEGSSLRRLVWLGAELALSFLIVLTQGTVVRPALIYLLPTSRALLMFGPRLGLALTAAVWLTFGGNVFLYTWPDRLAEIPNYLSFFLAPYILAVVLTLAILRQAADRRKVQALYDELRLAHEQLKAMHQQARELAITDERNRLAREIHDSLAHYLTVINVQLEAAEKLASDQTDRAMEQVSRARRLALECLREVRRSVAALRAATLEELSLSGALSKLATEFSENTGISVQLKISLPEDSQISAETGLALFRVAQEGLTNVQRHAKATSVVLALSRQNGNLEITVQDNGIGSSDSDRDKSAGFGLIGLRERVELLDGHLTFGPAESGGSRLTAVLPASEAR